MTRLQQLEERRERLIEGNSIHGWVRTKPEKYFMVLGKIRFEIRKEQLRMAPPKTVRPITMSAALMRSLTDPMFSGNTVAGC